MKRDKDFIGPVNQDASELMQVIRYIGDINPSEHSTEWQIRMISYKCEYFKNVQGPFRDRFNEYMVRNRAAIESCLHKYVLTEDQQDWEYKILKRLEVFGVVIPEHFIRDSLIRRRLHQL